MTITITIVATAIVLWFAQGWYLNMQLESVHRKLDFLAGQFNGLREYLYEIDPQFDEERRLWNELNHAVNNNEFSFSGMEHMDFTRSKEEQGLRTLNTPF